MTFTDFLPLIVNGGFGLLFFVPPVLFVRKTTKGGVNLATILAIIIVFIVFGTFGVLFLGMGIGQTLNNLAH